MKYKFVCIPNASVLFGLITNHHVVGCNPKTGEKANVPERHLPQFNAVYSE